MNCAHEGITPDEILRDRLVLGLKDDGMRERLLRVNDLTLGKALDICKAAEQTSVQIHEMQISSRDSSHESVGVVKQQQSRSTTGTDRSNNESCKYCGHLLTVPLSNERGGDVAELLVTVAGRKPLCLRCRRVGHIRRACTTPYCRRHGVYGHSTEECDGTVASYALAARPRLEPEVVEEAPAGTIPGEEEETAAEVDTPAIVSVQATAGVKSAVQPAFVPPCAATAVGLNNDWPPLTAASDPLAGNVRPGNVRPDNGDQANDNQEDWSALCAAAYRSLSESSDNEGEWTIEGRHSRRRKRRKPRSPQAGSRFELEVDSDAPAEGRAMC